MDPDHTRTGVLLARKFPSCINKLVCVGSSNNFILRGYVQKLILVVLGIVAAGSFLLAKESSADDTTFDIPTICCGTPNQQMAPQLAFTLTVETPGALFVQFRYSTMACGSARMHFSVDGTEIAVTPWLGYPGDPLNRDQWSPLINLGQFSPGLRTLRLDPEGQVDGCNSGTLIQWEGTLRIVTSCQGDEDCDSVADAIDNCPTTPNSDQLNTDENFIDHSPPYNPNVDDRTRIRSDVLGDACDPDDDNDLISDDAEASCSFGTDPLDFDSDNDRVYDGAECAFGSDPSNPGSRPTLAQCAALVGVTTTMDSDGDRLVDAAEMCYLASNRFSTDTDGDRMTTGASDGCEAASFNGDRIVNVADMGMLASAISHVILPHVNIDVNKDGFLNPADQGLVASFISPSGQCP